MEALYKFEPKWNADKHPAPLGISISRLIMWSPGLRAVIGFRVCLPGAASMSEWGSIPIEKLRIARESSRRRSLQRQIRTIPPRITYHGFLLKRFVLPRNTDAEHVFGEAHYKINQVELANHISTASRFIWLFPR